MIDHICKVCDKQVLPFPHTCSYCGRNFCAEHRLPEKHNCENIEKVKESSRLPRTEELLREISEFEKAARMRKSKSLFEKLKGIFKL